MAQRQLCAALRSQSWMLPKARRRLPPARTIGYFDGFSLWSDRTIMATFVSEDAVDAVWTACGPTAAGIAIAILGVRPVFILMVYSACGKPHIALGLCQCKTNRNGMHSLHTHVKKKVPSV